ncbi:MAG: hypothetical protein R3D88_04535 [Alphaproteobacteria bacterium]|nr:hypothetical protein [Alphaproteobacteria bacterium]
MIQLAKSGDGRLIIASNQPFPADIRRVEYYRKQKLFNLVFEGRSGESELMPCEVQDDIAEIIENSPEIIVIAMKEKGVEPYGYLAPLVQIGV